MTTNVHDLKLDKRRLINRGWSKPLMTALLPPPACDHTDPAKRLWERATIDHLEAIPEVRAKIDEVLEQHHAQEVAKLRQCDCPGAGVVTGALLQEWGLAVAMLANGGDRTAALQALTRYDLTDLRAAGQILFELAQGGEC